MMKSILSASVCAAALAFAVPAMAATDSPKHAHHHMGKHGAMSHDKKSGKGGDASTEQLNEKSLAAARGGSTTGTDTAAPGATTTAPATGGTAPATGAMTPPASGTTGSTTPMNAPGGGQ